MKKKEFLLFPRVFISKYVCEYSDLKIDFVTAVKWIMFCGEGQAVN